MYCRLCGGNHWIENGRYYCTTYKIDVNVKELRNSVNFKEICDKVRGIETKSVSKKLSDFEAPINLEQSLNILNSFFTEKSKEEFKLAKDISKYKFHLGGELRKIWNLWNDNNVLKDWFGLNYKINNPIDITDFILYCWHYDLNKSNRKIEHFVKSFLNYREKLSEADNSKKSYSVKIVEPEIGVFETQIIY